MDQDIMFSNIQFMNVVLAALRTMNQTVAAYDTQDNPQSRLNKTDKSANPKNDENPKNPTCCLLNPPPLIGELVGVRIPIALEKTDYKKTTA